MTSLPPAQLLSIARAYRPLPSPDGGLWFAPALAGVGQTARTPRPARFPARLAPSQDRTLPVAESPLGLLVRQDRGGDEVWQLGLIDGGGSLRRLTRDGRGIHRDVKVSPDGRRAGLAYNPDGRPDWVLGAIDLETGEIQRWLDRGGYWTWLGWREDGAAAVVTKLMSPVRSEAFLLSPQGELQPLLSGARLVESAAWVGGLLLVLSDLERDFVGL